MVRCTGQVVSVLALQCNDPRVNHTEVYNFYVLEKNEDLQKEAVVGHLTKFVAFSVFVRQAGRIGLRFI